MYFYTSFVQHFPSQPLTVVECLSNTSKNSFVTRFVMVRGNYQTPNWCFYKWLLFEPYEKFLPFLFVFQIFLCTFVATFKTLLLVANLALVSVLDYSNFETECKGKAIYFNVKQNVL